MHRIYAREERGAYTVRGNDGEPLDANDTMYQGRATQNLEFQALPPGELLRQLPGYAISLKQWRLANFGRDKRV